VNQALVRFVASERSVTLDERRVKTLPTVPPVVC
jgi:hypothetical protein